MDAASDSNGIQELSNCVRRIAFLGTPHQGSDKARWAETAKNFLKIFKTTNAELSKDLNEKSEKLAKLGDRFPRLLNSRAQTDETRIEVHCFFEGLSTRVGGIDIDTVCQTTLITCEISLTRTREDRKGVVSMLTRIS